jgi:predicted RNA-binding Zn-ribbon protein involved in translation (DUF1610 family)
MFREEVNPVDEGSFFKRLLVKNNWRITDLAIQIHKSPAYVSRRVQLTDADPQVVDALRDSQINISVADELVKVDDPATRARLLHYAIKSGATVDTVRSWRVQYESDMLPPPPAYVERNPTYDQAGNPILPLAVPFDDIPPPALNLKETVNETRSCFSCMGTFDTKNIYVIFLCPECRATIEKALRAEPETPETRQAINELKGDENR